MTSYCRFFVSEGKDHTMKVKKGSITIKLANGSFQVDGFIFGEWGYHRTVFENYDGSVFSSKDEWTVTHIPSGTSATRGIVTTMKQARAIAMRLEKEIPVWHDDCKEAALKIIREEMR